MKILAWRALTVGSETLVSASPNAAEPHGRPRPEGSQPVLEVILEAPAQARIFENKGGP